MLVRSGEPRGGLPSPLGECGRHRYRARVADQIMPMAPLRPFAYTSSSKQLTTRRRPPGRVHSTKAFEGQLSGDNPVDNSSELLEQSRFIHTSKYATRVCGDSRIYRRPPC